MRLTSAGTLDTTFDSDGKQNVTFTTSNDGAWRWRCDPDDRIIVAGYAWNGLDSTDFAIARLDVESRARYAASTATARKRSHLARAI